ncbi:EAL domain-containing protein [bacterium SCSIO 12696]|nr:EAL domain-containing protein [bacterium SCSIO 12696]
MQSQDNTLKTLFIHDHVDEADRMASLLRNAGYKVSPKHVESEGELPQLLQNNHWDLILAQYECTNISMQAIFHNTRRLNRDIPVVTITEQPDTARLEGLRLGASDVVTVDDDQHLLLVVSRALYNLGQRRRLRHWKRRYSEAETRCQQLLDNSRDAIAIIKEGTYMYSNDSYAQLFGYMDKDEMLCLPVIDTIAPKDQEQIKALLKTQYSDETWESSERYFQGMRSDDLPIDLTVQVSQIEYEDEPALQFCINHSFFNVGGQPIPAAHNAPAPAQEPSTGGGYTEIRLHKLIEHINGAIRRAAQMSKDSLLMLIKLDQFDTLREENGIKLTEDLLHTVAELVEKHTPDQHTLSRFQEDSFIMLLPATDADNGLRLGESLCSELAQEIITIGQQTFAATLSIGITVISETVTTVESAIGRCADAIGKLRDEQGSANMGNGARLYELEFSPSIEEIGANTETMGRRLLGNEQYELLFQPIINLHGAGEPFYEVLIHIRPEANPKNYPVDFISQIFKTDAGSDIDRWVIRQALTELREKQVAIPETRLFINLSRATFCDPGFIAWIKDAIAQAGIATASLIFQLRELDIGRYLNQATEVCQALRELGSQVSLSHFGLSLDPMTMLERLSVDYVKLDRMLVDKAQEGEGGQEAIEETINQLRAGEERIIVPFIENPAMMPTLWKMGVHYIQGHYLQAPQPHMNYDFTGEQ